MYYCLPTLYEAVLSRRMPFWLRAIGITLQIEAKRMLYIWGATIQHTHELLLSEKSSVPCIYFPYFTTSRSLKL